MAVSALFKASKWRELVTIVSLLLKAPVFTKEVKASFKAVIPVFSFAESKIKSAISDCNSALSWHDNVSVLLAITNKRLFGKRFLMVSISSKKTSLECANLFESNKKTIN
ncbi:MAG: Uncharacterised protein [Polaribacter sp. SA4-10]|nr:MAG: Uncharacterised protein [Polaribacter sp. SA4-10]